MKIKEFQEFLKKKDIDAAIFLNTDENKRDKSIFYFSNIDTEFACLVIPKEKSPFLIIGALEEEMVKKKSRIKKIILLDKKFFEQLKRLVGNAKKIGINFNIITLKEKKMFLKHFKNVKFVDISKEVTNLRIQKTDDEIEKIRKACKITDNIFSKITSNFKFKNEKEIETFIENEAKKNGCTLSFPSIVASNKNASMPHYKDNNCEIKKGFLLMDFGVRYQGYNSDITRTIYVGTPSEKEFDEYYKLLGVQEETIRQLKPNVDFKKLNENVKKVLGENFIHSLGHGLGIDVHELVSTEKKMRLKENTVLTIEPGIYYLGRYGIRIEDDVLITKKGYEVLTKAKKELIIVQD